MSKLPEPAKRPTMYFVGVTTGQSSIMKMFPIWAKELGLDAEIKGIDLPIHAPAEDYRAVVQFFRDDPLSLGALVTTHKIDMYNAAKDMFDYLDPYAQRFGELSSISKLDGQLRAHAKDPISSGLALDAFVPEGHWLKTGAEVCIIGAGGSALSISAYLGNEERHGKDLPSRIHLNNRSAPRLYPWLDPGDRRGLPHRHHRRAAGRLRPAGPGNEKVTPRGGLCHEGTYHTPFLRENRSRGLCHAPGRRPGGGAQ